MCVHLLTTSAMSFLVDFLLQHPLAFLQLGQLRSPAP
jgi:hypothetical protein